MKGLTIFELLVIVSLVVVVLSLVVKSIKNADCKEWRTIPGSMECWGGMNSSFISCEPKRECLRYK